MPKSGVKSPKVQRAEAWEIGESFMDDRKHLPGHEGLAKGRVADCEQSK